MASIKYKTNEGYVSIPLNIIGSRVYLEDYDDGEVVPELVDDNAKLGNGIGTCSTSSGTALEVNINNYRLVKNGIVAVTFENDVPANATLNINNKGAKAIYNEGSAIEADVIKAGKTVMFAYDGTNYVVTSLGGGGDFTSMSTITVNLKALNGDIEISQDFQGIQVTLTDTITQQVVETITVGQGETSVTFANVASFKDYIITSTQLSNFYTPSDITIQVLLPGLTTKNIEYKKIQYAYIKINQLQSDPNSMITVSETLDGPSQILDSQTNKHANKALQAIRDASHLYLGTFSNNKMQLKQLKDNDGTKYLDGTTAAMDGTEGDHFLRIGIPFYIKRVSGTDSGNIIVYAICVNHKPDNTWKQIITPNNLLGVHKAYSNNNNLYSRSGVNPSTNISSEDLKTYARNRGTGFTCVTWEWHCVMALLFMGWYCSTNSQAKCGSTGITQDELTTMGQKDSFGMIDTTNSNGNTNSIKFWGIEDWWGHSWECIDNFSPSNGVITITDINTGNVRSITGVSAASGLYTELLFSENLDLIPTKGGGTTTTYYCDMGWASNGLNAYCLRAYASPSEQAGIFCLHWAYDGHALENTGSRLAFSGEVEII